MKFIDLYDTLDFCFPIKVQEVRSNETLYVGSLSSAPMTLASIEVYLVSFNTKENQFIIYFEEDKEE